jgi:hypothetical protein
VLDNADDTTEAVENDDGITRNERKLKAVHEQMLKEFDEDQQAVYEERAQCLADRRFYSISGAMWEDELGEQFENKPKFEVNKIHLAVIRIINEYRNNRITVSFDPKDGSENENLSDTCAGLFRADEKASSAQEAYDNAFEEAVGGGFGAWRITNVEEDEEDEEDDRQRTHIEPIFDADSTVFFDCNSKRRDKSNAMRAHLLTSMTPDAYKERYGDDITSFDKAIMGCQFDWASPDLVWVNEYYKVEERKETVRVYRSLEGTEKRYRDNEFKEHPELEADLKATGWREVRRKKIKTRRVHKYIASGTKILEDCGYIPGKMIPIVPVFAKRWFVDGIERCMGHVRLAKDASRLKNMLMSWLAEIAAAPSIEIPIFDPEQMVGVQNMWETQREQSPPYMLANRITGPDGNVVQTGPIGYTKVPNIPPAIAALLQITEQDIQDLLGNQQAGEEVHANVSGKVIELIQNRLDMQAFIYIDNFAIAMKRGGEIWLSMNKELQVEEGRKRKIINENGKPGSVELMRPVIGEDGSVTFENDLTSAELEVDVDVGPSSMSKRQTTVRNLLAMLQVAQNDQSVAPILLAMIMMNMEGEGIGDVRDYFRRRLLSMGAVKPTEEEAAELANQQANQQPDPQTKFLMASAEAAEAAAADDRASTLLKVNQSEKVAAETAEVYSKIDLDHQRQAIEAARLFSEAQPDPQPEPMGDA